MSKVIDELSSLRLQKGVYLFTTLVTPGVYDFYKDDYNFEVSMRALNLKEQQKVRSIKDQKFRFKLLINRLFTKMVLNRILCHYSGETYEPFKELALKYTDFGKPYLEQDSFAFSSSSSNDVVCVVAELDTAGQVGVDLSHSAQNISLSGFMNDFKDIFHESEIAQLQALSEDKRYVIFNQFWTLKEAFTKLIGTGLNIDLRLFYFNLMHQYITEKTQFTLDHPESLNRVPIKWRTGITVNADDLEHHPHVRLISSRPYNCYSGTIVAEKDALPVIVSIINQDSSVITAYNLNSHSILKAVVEHANQGNVRLG